MTVAKRGWTIGLTLTLVSLILIAAGSVFGSAAWLANVESATAANTRLLDDHESRLRVTESLRAKMAANMATMAADIAWIRESMETQQETGGE